MTIGNLKCGCRLHEEVLWNQRTASERVTHLRFDVSMYEVLRPEKLESFGYKQSAR